MSYILDMCCGTQSIKTAVLANGFEYVGLDINSETDKAIPNIVSDIKNWDYKSYFETNGKPSFIWFSPPCCEYSCLNYARPEKTPDIVGSNKIVKAGLEIIDYCACQYMIENLQTSKLKNQDFMTFPYCDIDYCAYGFPYKKRTRLWNNISFVGEKCKGKECPYKENGRHQYSIGNSTYKTNVREVNTKKSRLGQRYSIPEPLLNSIIKKVRST